MRGHCNAGPSPDASGVRAPDGVAGRLDDRAGVAFVKGKRAQSAEDDESWRADEVAPTLNSFDVGDTRATVAVVRALRPESAVAWFNEGTALEASGQAAAAREKYEEALRRDARYSPALNNVGALLLKDGRLADARKIGRAHV
mgnify:CR=1 FL=1